MDIRYEICIDKSRNITFYAYITSSLYLGDIAICEISDDECNYNDILIEYFDFYKYSNPGNFDYEEFVDEFNDSFSGITLPVKTVCEKIINKNELTSYLTSKFNYTYDEVQEIYTNNIEILNDFKNKIKYLIVK